MKPRDIIRAIRSELYIDFERMIQITLIGIVALIIWAFLQKQENPLETVTAETVTKSSEKNKQSDS